MFGKEQKTTFEKLKECLSSTETLGYFDKDAPMQVNADASPVGLGTVLTQTHKDGPRIISYASLPHPTIGVSPVELLFR